MGNGVRALVWGGDPALPLMHLPEDVWTYGFQPQDDFSIRSVRLSAGGMALVVQTPMGTASFSVPLVGRFNALNAVAALGIGLLLGIPLQEMAAAFEQVNGAPGRMERVGALNGLTVVVDYAHTPDALRGALLSLRELTDGRVGVVFGCGGDRDREKRPLMGRIAEELADYVVVTSDNPRTEPPEEIIQDILAGFDEMPTHIEVSREEAIAWGIQHGRSGDLLLIAGKGHETYQEIGETRYPFDDRLVALNAMGAQ